MDGPSGDAHGAQIPCWPGFAQAETDSRANGKPNGNSGRHVLKKNKNQLLPLNVWTLIEHDSGYTLPKGPFQQGLRLC